MKKKYLAFLALALTALVITRAEPAEQNEAELLQQAKITRTQAERIALEKVPHGKVEAAELEKEHRALVWSFDIARPGSKDITEVQVDAKTGKIVSVTVETPADQAKEKVTDKAESKH